MRPILLLPIFAPLLASCASFNAMPDPVLTVRETDQMVRPLTVPIVISEMAKLQDEGQRKTYRNQVIATYLAAADARYIDFLRSLSRQSKASNFGLDLATLSLSSVAAIAKSAANELSTGAAIATGARGSLNKEVYFEKTLPAVIAAMEARRITVRGEIEKRMQGEGADTYTLEQGFADIMRYQMATTLDGAIQEITSSAGERESEAKEEYKDAVKSCTPPTTLRPIWREINKRVYDLAEAGEGEKLASAAEAVGAEKNADANEQAAAVMKAVTQKCTVAEAEALLARIPAE